MKLLKHALLATAAASLPLGVLSAFHSNSTACTRTYQVVEGDTCDKIGQKTLTSTYQILAFNLLESGADCYTLEIGSTLCLGRYGNDCQFVHQCSNQDTCESIASQYGISTKRLKDNNPSLDCDVVYDGLMLCVSAGSIRPPADNSINSTDVRIAREQARQAYILAEQTKESKKAKSYSSSKKHSASKKHKSKANGVESSHNSSGSKHGHKHKSDSSDDSASSEDKSKNSGKSHGKKGGKPSKGSKDDKNKDKSDDSSKGGKSKDDDSEDDKSKDDSKGGKGKKDKPKGGKSKDDKGNHKEEDDDDDKKSGDDDSHSSDKPSSDGSQVESPIREEELRQSLADVYTTPSNGLNNTPEVHTEKVAARSPSSHAHHKRQRSLSTRSHHRAHGASVSTV